MNTGLRIDGLTVMRGSKRVLDDVDIVVAPGKVTALLGANGAGKSSLVLACCGVLPIARGAILADGQSLNGRPPEDIRALGVAVVPEGHRVLGGLSVIDNLKVAGSHHSRAGLDVAVDTALETFPELRERLQSRAGDLSGGQQQMVALGQAIVAEPRYLIADELSFGLAPIIVDRLVPVLAQLAAQGVGILLIEQFTNIALKLAQHAYVLERGRVVFSGESAELIRNPQILHSAYLA
jgi:branched-chain amino acid transport system ATP-binding protein